MSSERPVELRAKVTIEPVENIPDLKVIRPKVNIF